MNDAERMAQVCFDLSNSIDDYRLDHFLDLTPEERATLKAAAQALDTRGHEFTAEALGDFLQALQPHLVTIQQATGDARDALRTLTRVATALSVIDAAVALVGAIARHDLGALGGAIEGFRGAIGQAAGIG